MSGSGSPPRLPGLFHVGWVVRDCAAAQKELSTRLGAGPFRSAGEQTRFDGVFVHGKQTSFALRIAFGALGGVLLELLEPLDDRSPHAEFLASRGEGLHHLAFLVADFDEQLAAVRRSAGGTPAELLIDGTGPDNPVRWAYVDASESRGTVIELLERTPQSEALFGGFLELLGSLRVTRLTRYARERKSRSSRARSASAVSPPSAMHCWRPVAMMVKPARSRAREAAASCVTTSAQSRPSSIILITPPIWPCARLSRLIAVAIVSLSVCMPAP
jgi:glyoxalase/bleomycin resistance protein/dioxygenase superfamily protein